jgi:hypothetical protein
MNVWLKVQNVFPFVVIMTLPQFHLFSFFRKCRAKCNILTSCNMFIIGRFLAENVFIFVLIYQEESRSVISVKFPIVGTALNFVALESLLRT